MEILKNRVLLSRGIILTIALAAILIIASFSASSSIGVDWKNTSRPAARELLFARSPYTVPGFYSPPWALLPVLPLALLPENIGHGTFLVISFAALGYTAYRLGAKPLSLFAFLLSPPVLHGMVNANLFWLPLLGFVLPPQIGMFLVVIKPQIGGGVALFWVIEAWRKGGWREVVRVAGPVTVALLASFLIFGFWPERWGQTLGLWWNASLWPMSIPVGLVLMATAVRRRRAEYAMGVAPCLSPYVLFHAWSGGLLAIVSLQAETIVATIGLWILVIIRALG